MAKRATIEVNGVVYRKSSWSDSGQLCVGVAFQNNEVLVINTNTQDAVLRFTKEEWRAFLAGEMCIRDSYQTVASNYPVAELR